MSPAEVEAKIQDLLDSHEAENVYIGLCLMMSQLELSMEAALRRLQPHYQYKSEGNFKASYKIGHVQLEYEYEKGYVPYMGTGATVSRMLGIWDRDQLEYQLDYAAFLKLEDQDGMEDAKKLLEEDYQELVPWLEDFLE